MSQPCSASATSCIVAMPPTSPDATNRSRVEPVAADSDAPSITHPPSAPGPATIGIADTPMGRSRPSNRTVPSCPFLRETSQRSATHPPWCSRTRPAPDRAENPGATSGRWTVNRYPNASPPRSVRSRTANTYSTSFLPSNSMRASGPLASSFRCNTLPCASCNVSNTSRGEPNLRANTSATHRWSGGLLKRK